MRYVQGLAVAALIVVGYVLAQGGLTAPPQASPSPAVSLPPFGVPVSPPSIHSGPVVLATPPHLDTPPPIPLNALPTPPPLQFATLTPGPLHTQGPSPSLH